jgi:hypothetical protein
MGGPAVMEAISKWSRAIVNAVVTYAPPHQARDP